MAPGVREEVFGHATLRRLADLAEVDDRVLHEVGSAGALRAMARAEVLVTGWGCPRIGADLLDQAPGLRLIAHAAGTVKTFLDPAVLDRGVRVTSAADANAVPVAEFAYAAIVFGAKRAFTLAHRYRETGTRRDFTGLPWLGTRDITVGLIGLSRIGRRVMELLRGLDAEVLVYDPYAGAAEITALGGAAVDLDTLVRRSHVVSLHAPETRETYRMLDARRLSMLRDGAVVVNTARGGLIDTEALVKEVRSGRLDAILDVSDPEPLPPGHPLFDLPNAFVTPHLAGAQGNELARLAESTLAEIARYTAGEPLLHEIHRDELDRMA
ncbi:phosphoglycerate dehydrogenase-like enzyme [Nonomuraea thailandensis]|uniref:Phosphoglycerate dehydrogenase-like enzyme n=2 Tax=Nonomuraea thailandensis TaxID=1188745 RepID=A0A9X2KA71_9ACTN|nr:hydroxyacid dehydrogenase [Nonomuraea thailandensis]MCP2365500.1 phosphoglycerate dehydrogenase-like enzyme [Nonomuraea thailandensis]